MHDWTTSNDSGQCVVINWNSFHTLEAVHRAPLAQSAEKQRSRLAVSAAEQDCFAMDSERPPWIAFDIPNAPRAVEFDAN